MNRDPLRLGDYLAHITEAIGRIQDYCAIWMRCLSCPIDWFKTVSFAISKLLVKPAKMLSA